MRRPRRRSWSAKPLLCTALLAAAAALLPAAGAGAATLQLAGPAGAVVKVNGAMVGFLPLAEPLTMPPGNYEIVCELPGCMPHRQTIRFDQDDDWRHVTVRVLPYSRKTAVFSNLALAGLGPRYLGHSQRGWLYTAAEAGGLLAALAGELGRSSAQKEYLLARDAYSSVINAGDIAALRAEADGHYQDAVDAADLRDLGLAVAAGAIVVSMLDSWLSFGAVSAGAGDLPARNLPAGDVHSLGEAPEGTPSWSAFHSAVRLSF